MRQIAMWSEVMANEGPVDGWADLSVEKAQRLREEREHLGLGPRPLTALEVADRPRPESGALGQGFLCQAAGTSVVSQQVSEGGHSVPDHRPCLSWHHRR